MPRPAEIEVEECAAPKGSYSLSDAFREAREPAAHAQRANAIAAAGQDLVRIGLVADVPDQPVVRRLENVVERDGQFDDAETRAQMAAGDGNRVDRFGAQFARRVASTRRARNCACRRAI